jgi:hypothetical protein
VRYSVPGMRGYRITGRRRLSTFVLGVASLILVGIPAGQAAYAAPAAASNVPSSGIGLATGLTAKGVDVVQNAAYYARASKSSLWGQTLDGLMYKSCIYGVPSGSYVDSVHGRIIEPDGKVVLTPQCPYPRLVPPGTATKFTATRSAATGSAAAAAYHPNISTWLDGFEADSLPHLSDLTTDLAAPYPPNNQGSFFEYQWTALASLGNSLLQPALGWGKLSVSNWRAPLAGDVEMAAYYLNGTIATAGTFYSVKPLDTVFTSIEGYNCGSGGGGCTWTMTITDENSGQSSTLTVGSSPTYTSVIGEYESNVGSVGGTNCQSLFANHHLVWRNLSVTSEAGSTVTPLYYQNGVYDVGAGSTVQSDSAMVESDNSPSNDTAADITWSNGCTSF